MFVANSIPSQQTVSDGKYPEFVNRTNDYYMPIHSKKTNKYIATKSPQKKVYTRLDQDP